MTAVTVEQVATMPTPFDPHPDYAEQKKRHAAGDFTQSKYWGQLYGGNRGLAGAFRKGALAALEGVPLDAVPYADHRTYRGGVTFSRAFERAWCEGWHVATYGDSTTCTLQPNHTAVACSFDYPIEPGRPTIVGAKA